MVDFSTDNSGDEDYVEMLGYAPYSGRWNDLSGSALVSYGIIEKPSVVPEPATLLLLGFGLLGLAEVKRFKN